MDGSVCRRPGRESVCFQVVVESDSALVSGLRPVVSDPALVSAPQLVVSDTARVSVPPVAGCEFPAALLGNVAFDQVEAHIVVTMRS